MEIRERLIDCLLLCLLLVTMRGAVPVKENSSLLINVTSSAETVSSADQANIEDILKGLSLKCKEDIRMESEYVLLENGSLLLPQDQQVYMQESYIVENDTAYICLSLIEVNNGSSSVDRAYNFSKEFLSCGHIKIEPHEYKFMENGSIYIEIYNKYYEPSDFYWHEQGVYVCLPNFSEMMVNSTNNISADQNKFSVAFVYVSLIGLGISIISLILHLLVFCYVPKVRNLPGCCLASLSVSLLLAYFCFVSSSAVSSKSQCASLGLCVYYFFLTSFFWMNAIAFDVWRSFRVVMKELRISSHRVPWRRFLLYSIYSWLTPAILAILAKVGDTTEIFPEDFRPSFGSHLCWFGNRKALLVFFATPLCIVMALNAIFFLDSSYVINMATIKTSQVEKAILTRRFFMFMRLAILMGLTWILGIIAGYVDNQVLWYVFIVLNTLQGLFIFIVFSCSSKVRIFSLLKAKSALSKRQSTSVRTISQAL